MQEADSLPSVSCLKSEIHPYKECDNGKTGETWSHLSSPKSLATKGAGVNICEWLK